jgi:uncharacterized protein (TIGR02271 family)
MATRTERSTVVGVFRDPDEARDAVYALKDAGFASDAIGILAPDRDQTRAMAEETGTHAGAGAGTGAVTGGILGGLAGWLVGVGALAIPGAGPFIAAGALATTLGGAAIGAGVGAIAGALVGMGVPEDEAKYYEGEVRGGRTLLTVRADGRYDEARGILRNQGAYDIQDRDTPPGGSEDRAASAGAAAGQQPRETDMAGREANAEHTLRLREEELHARKTPVETGEVGVRKEVVSEQQTLEVPVTREEIVVERRPADRREAGAVDTSDIGEGETVRVPVREEQVTVEKQPVVTEEVEIGKRAVQETEQVEGTVRREEARIEHSGQAPVSGEHRHDFVEDRCVECGARRN